VDATSGLLFIAALALLIGGAVAAVANRVRLALVAAARGDAESNRLVGASLTAAPTPTASPSP
jgi:hypothetical protein